MLTSPKYSDFKFKVRILWTKKTKAYISLPTSSEAGWGVTQGGFWVV